MSTDALSCLQFAAECFLVDLFSDMNKLARHAKRATVMVQDLDVLCVLYPEKTLCCKAILTRSKRLL